jgi:hypothetical protein
MWAVARSISRPVRERLYRPQEGRSAARLLAVFERACDLITQDGDVLALVTPQIGDGPLNIVVDGAEELFAGVDPGAPVTLELEEERLWIGGLGVDLGGATVWEPRPDWHALRARRAAIAPHLPLLQALCLRHAPPDSLLALLGAPPPGGAPAGAILSTAQEAAEVLREGWGGDLGWLQEGATELAGLGGGLTPAGDDFLTGAMLWAWLAHPTPGPLCRALAEVAVPRTTALSAAFLRAAAQGECSAPWHALLAALSEGPIKGKETEITAAAQAVLAHGATSGADGLAGFLYIGMARVPHKA